VVVSRKAFALLITYEAESGDPIKALVSERGEVFCHGCNLPLRLEDPSESPFSLLSLQYPECQIAMLLRSRLINKKSTPYQMEMQL
jgi:hypothetical protein